MMTKLIEDEFDSVCLGLDGLDEPADHEWQSYGLVAKEENHLVEGYECLRCDHVAYKYHPMEEV